MQDADLLRALETADLELLGFRPDDASDFRALVRSVRGERPRLRRIGQLVAHLRGRIGELFEEPRLPERTGANILETGLDLMLALVVIARDVHHWYVERGVPSATAWRSLSDLGQQVHVFRDIFGFLGLSTWDWSASNYSGRMLWLGRLQFTLERDHQGHTLGIHIPESGRLTSDAVDDALAQAGHWFPAVYPEFPIARWHIESWMVDPTIVERLSPESNLRQFAGRFTLTGARDPGPWAPVFFVFKHDLRLEPIDLSALPARTSLQRACLSVLDMGAGGSYEATLREVADPATGFPNTPVSQ